MFINFIKKSKIIYNIYLKLQIFILYMGKFYEGYKKQSGKSEENSLKLFI